ncbi:MAG: DUF1989 domain-containing protein [Parvibaculaceae bacterium]
MKAEERNYGTFRVPAAEGAAFRLARGDTVQVINESGSQVVDFWCLSLENEAEHLSMGHCREVLGKIFFDPGDVLISDRYAPLLEYVADTAGGRHDTLIAACSEEMYLRFGREKGHPSCASNFERQAQRIGWPPHLPPQPWNLFMRAEVGEDGRIAYSRPPFIPDGTVTLKALAPMLAIVSACPDDCYPTNGGDGSPRAFTVRVDAGA